MARSRTTNEQEFQGQVVSWLNQAIAANRGLELDRATQESRPTRKRNDLVVWVSREAERAFLTGELKTPTTLLSDPSLLRDACEKAQRWRAPYFFIWNMQAAELFRTPPAGTTATPSHRVFAFPPDPSVRSVEDWLKPRVQPGLRQRAIDILEKALEVQIGSSASRLQIDASIFVEKLSGNLYELRHLIAAEIRRQAATKRRLRLRIRSMAAMQGFIGFVDDLDDAIAGQLSYRLVGQVLFYFALRRKLPALPELVVDEQAVIPDALTPFWNEVRRFDYEALFQPSELEELVALPATAQDVVRRLIHDWSSYDWGSLDDDVLGAIFERLIPPEEQMLLGQFYTPRHVADLILALALDGGEADVLDPGCGSGTFLMRAYSLMKAQGGLGHAALLSKLWGFDVSAFACELAVINLFRQDFAETFNFPRVRCSDFFESRVGDLVEFPPATASAGGSVRMPIPLFDAVVGNPPYLRSQNQDDLNTKYRTRLFAAAARQGLAASPKTDLFGFFTYQALGFLREEGRLGFVTSASWLTAEFGAQLQKTLLERCRIVAVIASSSESFFSQVDVNTVLLVVERRPTGPTSDELIRFVVVKKPLGEIFADGSQHWTKVQTFADDIESTTKSLENDTIRIIVRNASAELKSLAIGAQNWSQYLRAPLVYFDLFGTVV